MLSTSESTNTLVPSSAGNLFLRDSETQWYVRWNGHAAYIGSEDRRRQSAIDGLGMLEKLLGSPGNEISSVTLFGFDGDTTPYVSSAVFQEFGADQDDGDGADGATDSKSKRRGFKITSFLPDRYERNVGRAIDLAKSMIRRKIPLLADHLDSFIKHSDYSWSYRPFESDVCELWTLGRLEEFDGSNFLRREGRKWLIRFGHQCCAVSQSDGIEILATLLQNPGINMTAEQIRYRGPVPKSSDLEPSNPQLAGLLKFVQEFLPEIRQLSSDDDDYRLPDEPADVADELKKIIPLLKDCVKARARGLRRQGIAAPLELDDEFRRLCQRLLRCERLITHILDFSSNQIKPASSSGSGKDQQHISLMRWVRDATSQAMDEIRGVSPTMAAYFSRNLRIDHRGASLDVASRWKVTRSTFPQ